MQVESDNANPLPNYDAGADADFDSDADADSGSDYDSDSDPTLRISHLVARQNRTTQIPHCFLTLVTTRITPGSPMLTLTSLLRGRAE